MGRTPSDVTHAELSILQILWDRNDATIRELADALYPGGSSSDYATVQKLLSRLVDKNCVKRSKTRPFRFTPIVTRETLIDRRLQDTAESLCGGSVTPLLTQLVAGRNLSAEDRAHLLELVDKLDKGPDGAKR